MTQHTYFVLDSYFSLRARPEYSDTAKLLYIDPSYCGILLFFAAVWANWNNRCTDTSGCILDFLCIFWARPIGGEIEDPFGLEPNDLPLKAISRNIEINLLKLINEPDRLGPLKPKNGILM